MRAYRARRGFPEIMSSRQSWCRADGKRPIMCDGSPASSTDPGTWATLREVRNSRAGDGFGVMLGRGLGCYDLDHVTDEEISAFLADIAEPVLMVERSVSGEGAHIFIEAPEAPGWRRGGIERYTRTRFVRVTGRRF